jgi:hypothetical protein
MTTSAVLMEPVELTLPLSVPILLQRRLMSRHLDAERAILVRRSQLRSSPFSVTGDRHNHFPPAMEATRGSATRRVI